MRIKLKKATIVNIANLLLLMYMISIYIWSDNENNVYSNILCVLAMIPMIFLILERKILKISKLYIPIISFVIFSCLSVLWAVNRDLSLTMVLRTLPILIIFSVTLFTYISSTNQFEYLLLCIYFSGLFLSIYTLLTNPGGISGYFQELSTGIRAGSEVNNVNTIGMASSISLIISIFYIVYEKKYKYLISIPILLIVSFGTGSNKALISIILGVFLIIIMNIDPKKRMKSICKIMMGIVLVSIMGYWILQLPLFTTINQRFTGMIAALLGKNGANHSATIRLILIDAGMDQFFKTPILGIGINNGATVAAKVVGKSYYLHNNYVELLVDVGVIGTLLFYTTPFICLKRCLSAFKRNNKTAIITAIILIVWLVTQYGQVCYYSKFTYIYVALGCVAATDIYLKKRNIYE